jgi:GNAT superfamily N-acetyltransferase
LIIRLARAEDAPELARLADELDYPTSVETMRQRCSVLDGRSDHAVFVAEQPAGGLLGWAHVASTITLESGESGELAGLVVARAARRGGVGRQLVAAAEEWCRDRGLERMVVRSNVKRTEAHRFYPSIGYPIGKTQHVYVKKLQRRQRE